jgi:hypothetical protein
MISRFASPYDQNPARLALIMKSNRKKARTRDNAVAFRVLFSMAVIGACIWLVVPL